jgi:hypothetical protein
MNIILAVFVCTYLSLAVGSLPGLKIDRTGAALAGRHDSGGHRRDQRPGRLDAISYQTIGLLFGLMIVSSRPWRSRRCGSPGSSETGECCNPRICRRAMFRMGSMVWRTSRRTPAPADRLARLRQSRQRVKANPMLTPP